MKVRPFNAKTDYDSVCDWWKKQDWPVMPLEMLRGQGFVADDKEDLIAATWVFPTTSPIYIMEWTIGNPDIDWKKREEGINLVIEESACWSKEKGASLLFTMVKEGRFLNKLKNNKFNETDRDMVHMMRKL